MKSHNLSVFLIKILQYTWQPLYQNVGENNQRWGPVLRGRNIATLRFGCAQDGGPIRLEMSSVERTRTLQPIGRGQTFGCWRCEWIFPAPHKMARWQAWDYLDGSESKFHQICGGSTQPIYHLGTCRGCTGTFSHGREIWLSRNVSFVALYSRKLERETEGVGECWTSFETRRCGLWRQCNAGWLSTESFCQISSLAIT